jgi:hypothetical protein
MIATFLLLAGIASLTGALPSLPLEAQTNQSLLVQPASQPVPPPVSSNAQVVAPAPPQAMPGDDAPESVSPVPSNTEEWDLSDEAADAGDEDDGSDADAADSDNTLAGFELGD